MKFIKKLFTETEMSWPFLLIYTVITGVVVGLLNCVPALENTSLTNPAVTLEYWFVAALFVIMNCRSGKEAAIKTFVFFLISQPLIYLVEVPFKADGWGLFRYYSYWAKLTLATPFMAWIAYQIKRDNILSALILSVATGYLVFTGLYIGINLLANFPKGIIAIVFCLFFGFAMIPMFLEKKGNRITALIVTIVLAVGMTVFAKSASSSIRTGISLPDDHEWTVVEYDCKEAVITGSYLETALNKDGVYHVTCENEAGERITFEVSHLDGSIQIHEVEE